MHRLRGWSVPGVFTEQQEAGMAGVKQMKGRVGGRRRREGGGFGGVTKGFVVLVLALTFAPGEQEL